MKQLVTMSDGRRFYDPLRPVVREVKGAGSDRVFLSCGHEIVANAKTAPRKLARCHHQGCRQWHGRVIERTVG